MVNDSAQHIEGAIPQIQKIVQMILWDFVYSCIIDHNTIIRNRNGQVVVVLCAAIDLFYRVPLSACAGAGALFLLGGSR